MHATWKPEKIIGIDLLTANTFSCWTILLSSVLLFKYDDRF